MTWLSAFPCTLLLAAVPDPDWLERAVHWVLSPFPHDPYGFFGIQSTVFGLLAVVLVSVICGCVGSLVVGSRMAFFSDALAHTAFAGISLGFLTALFAGVLDRGDFFDWATPIMVVFGILVGLGIAYVAERTSLANDTVIGVFFAGAMGFGAMLLKGISQLGRYFNPEDFLFGSPGTVSSRDLQILFLLAVLTVILLGVLYNQLLFTTFNPSLARSRRIWVRLCSYLFIALLAVIINVCLRTVGALLINALLIVPAATAANLSRNLRQMFWATVVLSVAVGVAGYFLAYHLKVPLSSGKPLTFGSGGMIVVLSVILFFGSLALAGWQRRRAAAAPAGPAEKAGVSS
ncbi:MAG TPA: metal ABC transporter permease [Gemmataceae bacterium]|nr:metal ABC transporter permease [Gemmataceae bacterium]